MYYKMSQSFFRNGTACKLGSYHFTPSSFINFTRSLYKHPTCTIKSCSLLSPCWICLWAASMTANAFLAVSRLWSGVSCSTTSITNFTYFPNSSQTLITETCTGHHQCVFVFPNQHLWKGGAFRFIDHFNVVELSRFQFSEQSLECSVLSLNVDYCPGMILLPRDTDIRTKRNILVAILDKDSLHIGESCRQVGRSRPIVTIAYVLRGLHSFFQLAVTLLHYHTSTLCMQYSICVNQML